MLGTSLPVLYFWENFLGITGQCSCWASLKGDTCSATALSAQELHQKHLLGLFQKDHISLVLRASVYQGTLAQLHLERCPALQAQPLALDEWSGLHTPAGAAANCALDTAQRPSPVQHSNLIIEELCRRFR